MKKNVIFRIAAIVLMCTLVTACFASSTFAKYTASATSSAATATVAKWDLKVNGNQQLAAANPTITFNLFDTIVDTVDGNKDANVKEDNTAKLIAPGTKGTYDMTVKNDSEVDARIKVTTSAISYANLPTGVNASDIKIVIAAPVVKVDNAAVTADDDGYYLVPMGKTATVTYSWTWVFSTSAADDAIETKLGIQGQTAAVTASVTATIDALQVD